MLSDVFNSLHTSLRLSVFEVNILVTSQTQSRNMWEKCETRQEKNATSPSCSVFVVVFCYLLTHSSFSEFFF